MSHREIFGPSYSNKGCVTLNAHREREGNPKLQNNLKYNSKWLMEKKMEMKLNKEANQRIGIPPRLRSLPS